MYSSISSGSGSEGFCRASGRSAGAELDIVLANTFGRADGSVPLAAPDGYVAQAPRSYSEADARE